VVIGLVLVLVVLWVAVEVEKAWRR